MKKLVKIYAKPKLNSPVMLAIWPGIGNVATIAGNYLLKKLDFKRLGEIESSYFFDPIGIVVRDHVVEAPEFPRNKFYYWKNRDGYHDLVLFIGDDQPSSKGYELANCVIDAGARFMVQRVYTLAAALTRIHHTEQPKVWGVGTTHELTQYLKENGLVQKGNLQIAGLNGLMLGVAKERDIEGICLLGEVPMYATKVQNPMASLMIVKTLSRILHFEIDLAELTQMAIETREGMKQAAAEAMGEYIDHFTEPIWESDETDEDFEE